MAERAALLVITHNTPDNQSIPEAEPIVYRVVSHHSTPSAHSIQVTATREYLSPFNSRASQRLGQAIWAQRSIELMLQLRAPFTPTVPATAENSRWHLTPIFRKMRPRDIALQANACKPPLD